MASRRLRSILLNLALMAGACLLLALILEGGLRLFPGLLPAGNYGHGRFSPDIGMNVMGGTVTYNKLRHLTHAPSSLGFLDVEHARSKPPGTIRIGFFGDSYTEAMQVPLEKRFFRLLPPTFAGRPVETLAFGLGGWGTVHSLINYRVQAPRFDIDLAVYVFVENDLGDSAYRLQAAQGMPRSDKPYARLSGEAPGFTLEYLRPPAAHPRWYRTAKAIHARSRLAQLLLSRLRLLRIQGAFGPPGGDAGAGGADMSETAQGVPRSTSLPGTWPEDEAAHVKELGRRLLAAWSDEVRRDGRFLAVLYVPRSEAMLRGDYPLSDTWRPWLGQVTSDLGIPLLDPSEDMAAAMARGVRVYEDHWTEAGHRVVARFLTRELPALLAGSTP
jgi:hypothetical protein